MVILDNLVDLPQVLDVTHEEITRPVCERDGEEICTALDPRPYILRHDSVTLRRLMVGKGAATLE
jgi:hypothetical protein